MATTRVLLTFPWNNNNNNGPNDKMIKPDPSGMSEQVLKVAKKELREDKTIREQSLQQMREWLKKNYDVENIRTDDSFLLRFLRTKKFSVPMAQQQLLKYLNMRRVLKDYTTGLDYLSPGVRSLIENGYVFPSPIRDKHGRRVIFYFVRNFDPAIHSSEDVARAHCVTYETLLESQENQILGVVHIGDLSGISTAHVNAWNPTDFMRSIKWGEQSVPMRHKEIHLCNLASFLKYVIDAVKAMISSKMKERLHCYTNIDDVKKKIDVEVLPKEMGGKIPMTEMIEMWKIELAAKRDSVVGLDNMKILSDRGIRGKRNNVDCNNNNPNAKFQDESLTGSFRKLEID